MYVAVDTVEVPAFSTIGVGEGINVDTGERVRFGGDHRPMRDLAFAVEREQRVLVEVEDWQVLGRFGGGQ